MRNSTPAPDAREICDAFALGTPRGDMAPVRGGLSHRLWRMETTHGTFAVKRLNRDFTNPDYVPSYERAFSLEIRAFSAGIPMPRPIPVATTGHCLAELSDDVERPSTVRVHEWIDGRAPRTGDDWTVLASTAASLIARIHSLRIERTETLNDTLAVRGEAGWQDLLERAEEFTAEWAVELRETLPVITELEAIVTGARRRGDALLMGHRDADAKNLMIARDGRIMLVDWDAAGPVSARMDVTKEAFTWAGAHDDGIDAHTHRIDARTVSAYFDGYWRGGGASFTVERDDFAELLHVMMRWYAFNVRRALGERLNDASDQALGEGIARAGFRSLRRYQSSIDDWVRVANTRT